MIYISHLLPDQDMRELIEETGAGIESIDFSIAENLDRLSECIKSYRKRMAYMRTRELILHGPYLDLNPVTYDREIMRVTKLRFAQAYTAALELGARKIVYHTGLYPDAYLLIGWAERIGDFFNEFLQARTQLQVTLENVFDRKWEPILEAAGRIEAPNFRLCLDLGHAHCVGEEDAQVWAEKLLPYIGHVHVHDNFGEKDAHMALGKGSLAVENVLKQLQKGNADTCTIECSKKEDVRETYRVLKNSDYRDL